MSDPPVTQTDQEPPKEDHNVHPPQLTESGKSVHRDHTLINELRKILKATHLENPSLINLLRDSETTLENQSPVEVVKSDSVVTQPVIRSPPELDWSKCELPEPNRFDYGSTFIVPSWDDNDRPFVRILELDEFELTEDEKNGILSFRIIGSCLSYLDTNPLIPYYIPGKLTCPNMGLVNIKCVSRHRYLTYIDFSNNNLEDLSVLSECSYLMYLDVSWNHLQNLLDFRAPHYLSIVNYEGNSITEIPDLTEFWSITTLKLGKNKISKISGLDNLSFLQYLDLSYNFITHLEGLTGLRIRRLILDHNLIETFPDEEFGLATNRDLRDVDLSFNGLTSLKIIKNVAKLKTINVSGNNILNLFEFNNLRGMLNLIKVNFTGNPVTEVPGYRQLCIDCVQYIQLLDDIPVGAREKVLANSVFTPDLSLCAMRETNLLTLLKHLNFPKITPITVPYDQRSVPLIILVGPYGSNRASFLDRLMEQHPKHLYQGLIYTTRYVPKSAEKISKKISREKFNAMVKDGEFLFTYQILGESYGFPESELINAVESNSVCITSSNFIGALTARMTGLNPWLIKSMPSTAHSHYIGLKQRFHTNFWSAQHPDTSAIKVERYATEIDSDSVEIPDIYEVFTKNIVDDGKVPGKYCCKCTCDCQEHLYENLRIESSYPILGDENSESSGSCVGDMTIFKEVPPEDVHEDSVDFIIGDILKERDVYNEMYIANPGLFKDTIETDKPEDGIPKILEHCKKLLANYVIPRKFNKIPNDEVYVNMVNYRLKEALDDFNMYENTALVQRKKLENPGLFEDSVDTAEISVDFDKVIGKYGALERLDPNRMPESKCPAHMMYTTYRTFTET